MDRWMIYALISALFAGITSVAAKSGLKEIPATLALGIRTSFIFIFISLAVFVSGSLNELKNLKGQSLFLLILSAATTTLSWLFYYWAMKEGKVSVIASIDKCSIVVTVLLSLMFLNEPLTLKLAIGVLFILIGLFVLVKT
ncbi:MAG: EamA family transporter [Candidatus Melainabacteria bacterium]|jgi:transporter family protein